MFKTINPFGRFFMSCINSLTHGLAIIQRPGREHPGACVLCLLCIAGLSVSLAAAESRLEGMNTLAAVDDAFVRQSSDGKQVTIGTRTIELTLRTADGHLLLTSFKNHAVQPAVEYINREWAEAPFVVEMNAPIGPTEMIKTLWEKPLKKGESADPGKDKLTVVVKKGDRIGFVVAHGGNYASTATSWPVTVEYDGGERYASMDDVTLGQGPIWFYSALRLVGATLVPLEDVKELKLANEKVKIRVVGRTNPAGNRVPWIGPGILHPGQEWASVRVWEAPRDGTVRVTGTAELSPDNGLNAIRAQVIEIRKIPLSIKEQRARLSEWTMDSVKGSEVNVGGRPAVQLDMILTRESLRVKFHIMAFPRTGILRQWLDLENVGTTPLKGSLVTILNLRLKDEAWSYTTVTGAENGPNSGTLKTTQVKPGFRNSQVGGDDHTDFIPFIILKRGDPSNDGWFAELDNEGSAKILTATRDPEGSINVEASSLKGWIIDPKATHRTNGIDLISNNFTGFLHTDAAAFAGSIVPVFASASIG